MVTYGSLRDNLRAYDKAGSSDVAAALIVAVGLNRDGTIFYGPNKSGKGEGWKGLTTAESSIVSDQETYIDELKVAFVEAGEQESAFTPPSLRKYTKGVLSKANAVVNTLISDAVICDDDDVADTVALWVETSGVKTLEEAYRLAVPTEEVDDSTWDLAKACKALVRKAAATGYTAESVKIRFAEAMAEFFAVEAD